MELVLKLVANINFEHGYGYVAWLMSWLCSMVNGYVAWLISWLCYVAFYKVDTSILISFLSILANP